MVNSQRRGEPTCRASAGAPIECFPRTEFRFGSDDGPPAGGGDRGPAHLSGQACPRHRTGCPLPAGLAFVVWLCERQNSNPLTQEDPTCLHRNPSPKSASGPSRPRSGRTAPPISRGITSPFPGSTKDGDTWKSTQSFGRNDLLLLAKVADQAQSRIFQFALPDGAEASPVAAGITPRRGCGRFQGPRLSPTLQGRLLTGDEQFGKLPAIRRIDRINALGVAAALIRAPTDKFIATELKQFARRWGRRFLEEALIVKSYTSNKKFWLTDPRWPVKNDNGKGNFKDMHDKSKPELSQMTPQARHHYTRFDQVDQLVGASEADPDIGFMARLLSLCSLPRTDPGDRTQYKRTNGPYTLYMIAGGGNQLPYGSLPRLILSWVCTEAVRTQSREIVLGHSLSNFMRKLGMDSVGGARTRVRNQMRRLFNTHVQLVYEDKLGEASVSSSVTSRTEFWWDPKLPDVPMIWESKIELGWDFFNEIIAHPVPLDMNILKALKRSTLGLDLYLWVTYRTFTLRAPLSLSWRQVYRQFGAHPDKANDRVTVRNFQRKVIRELKKIKIAWPGLNYTTAPGVLILHPSTPAIPPAPEPLRLVE